MSVHWATRYPNQQMHISLLKYIIPTVHLLHTSATRIEPSYRCKILHFKNKTWFEICIKNQNTDRNCYFLVPVCMRCDRRRNIVTYLKTSNSLPYHRSGLANLWHACPKWHAAFDTVPPPFFLFLLPGQVPHIVTSMCLYVYIHISDWSEIVYELPLLPNNTASETIVHKSGAVRSVDWVFIIGVPAWRWLGKYVTLGKTFYNLLFRQEVEAATVTAIFSSLSHYSMRSLLGA